jgi:hypothetical protein
MRRKVLRLALLALAILMLVPAPAALAEDITLGTTTAGTEKEKIDRNSVYGNVYTLDQPATPESFSAYVKGGTDDQKYRPVIFQVDAFGNPTSLVAIGSEVVIDETQAPAWLTTPMPGMTALPPGDYFVGIIAGARADGGRFFFDSAGLLLTGSNSYADPLQEFGPVTVVEGVTLSVYVTLQTMPKQQPQPKPEPQIQRKAPNRGGYCLNGKFLDLLYGQAAFDPTYQGATPAYYVEGKGLTCDPPNGLTYVGLYRGNDAAWDFYPYYR